MKSISKILLVSSLTIIIALFLTNSNLSAQQTSNKKATKGFVDLNKDGINDNAPDADGDGIPNGKDPDYTGAKNRKGNNPHAGFIDLNGDGINDNAIDSDGDGIPNGKDPDYVKPKDGTGNKYGYGKGSFPGKGTGFGTCDGTGPKGKVKRGGK